MKSTEVANSFEVVSTISKIIPSINLFICIASSSFYEGGNAQVFERPARVLRDGLVHLSTKEIRRRAFRYIAGRVTEHI